MNKSYSSIHLFLLYIAFANIFICMHTYIKQYEHCDTYVQMKNIWHLETEIDG